MKRRCGYVTDNYKKWDVVEVDIETVLSSVSQQHRLSDREQNARVTIFEPVRPLECHQRGLARACSKVGCIARRL